MRPTLLLVAAAATVGCGSDPPLPPPDLDAGTPLVDVALPGPDAWTDRGVVLEADPPGAWDARLHGMISPSTAIKRDGSYLLYYIGASGDREDGGPAHRRLGVATSRDGITFTKHPDNPVVEFSKGIPNCDECGVFSAAASVEITGRVTLYFGGMTEFVPGSVSGDVIYTVSEDGVHFGDQRTVVSHGERDAIGDDELFPIGMLRGAGEFTSVYYLAKGSRGLWDLAVAWGPSPDDLPGRRLLLDLDQPIIGLGDPIWISRGRILLPLLIDFAEPQIHFGITGNVLETATMPKVMHLPDVAQATMLLDRDSQTWFLYYLTRSDHMIRVMTAPMVAAALCPEGGCK